MDAPRDSSFLKHHMHRSPVHRRRGSNMHSNKTYVAVCTQSRCARGGVRRVLADSDWTDRGQEAAWSITSWSFCYSRDVSVLAAHVMASHERTVRTYEGPQRWADKGLSSLTFHFLFRRELSRLSRLARPNIVSIFSVLTSGVFTVGLWIRY